MDFKLVLEKLLTAFREQDIRYALMGGLALGAWGVPRGTVDIDFLVRHADMEKISGIMRQLGYECRYSTENVTQYVSPVAIFGEVDFLHAFRTPSLNMLQRAVERPFFNGTVPVSVVQVEDLIGLKVQAMANDASRRETDLSDIEALIAANPGKLDWSLIHEYFSLFEKEELFWTLKKKYGTDKQ
jgi:hypothetical protein